MAFRPAPVQDVTFDRIYEQQLAYVCHTLRRLGVPDRDREDVAHDVFMVVHRRLRDFDRARPLRPWLFGIAFRVVSDYRRSARVKREVVGAAPDGDAAGSNPGALESMIAREQRELVLTALDAIPLERRAVFIAAELDGLRITEIAEVIDLPLNTLYSHLRRARRDFADAVRRLTGRGGQS